MNRYRAHRLKVTLAGIAAALCTCLALCSGAVAAVRAHRSAYQYELKAGASPAQRRVCRTAAAARRKPARLQSRAADCGVVASGPVRPSSKRAPSRPATVGHGARSAPAQAPAPSSAAVIAGVLATPCQNTQLTPEAGNLALVDAAVLCLVNQERAQNGELPLVTNARLEAAAVAHNRDMVAADYFDHISPAGVSPVDRARESGYIPNAESGYVIGENIAWGTLSLSTPQAIVEAWIASPGHLANILESNYRETGIAVLPELPALLAPGVPGALYAQEFGVIDE